MNLHSLWLRLTHKRTKDRVLGGLRCSFVRGYTVNGQIVLIHEDGRKVVVKAPPSWSSVHSVPVCRIPDPVTDCEFA